jgi:NADPH:quinone reductase-like Zn-dependent oxidoreductase
MSRPMTMKAVRIHAYGGPEVLRYEDAPLPTLGADDLLVEVWCAAVNPVDWKIREGWLREKLPYALPFVLGWDVSGVVVEAGSGVTQFRSGDAVYARPDIMRSGCYAEYVAIDAHAAARKPEKMSHAAAAGVPLAALTAWKALFDEAGLRSGQTVLVHAASGGVGSFAVQIAKAFGAIVVATTSTPNVEAVRALGADRVVDYRVDNFATRVRDVDVVLDTLGGEVQERSWRCLRAGGTLVSVVSPPDATAARVHEAHARYAWVVPDGARLAMLADMIDAGKIRTVIDSLPPLAQAAAAHERSRSGHARGKIVLAVRND